MRIRFIKGILEGHSFELNSDSLLIGRSPENDIRIPDPSVSRQHAKLFRDGDKYYIRDLESNNGTWVDGHLVLPGREVEVNQGFRLSLGDTVMGFDFLNRGKDRAFFYSIDLASMPECGNVDFLFKDRRMLKKKNLELISEISEALIRPSEISAICDRIFDYIFYNMKRIDSCAILMVDKNSSNIYRLGDRAKDMQSGEDVKYSRSIVWQVVNEKKALMIADLDGDKNIEPSESMELLRIKSFICVPLISKGEIIGVIYAHSVDEPNGFRKDDLYLLVALSSFASLAIEKATRHAENRRLHENKDIQTILRHKLETIKSLAGVISHEFNNLLMCIQGETSLLLHDTSREDHRYKRIKNIEKYIETGSVLSSWACGYPVDMQYLKPYSSINKLIADSLKDIEYQPDIIFDLQLSPQLWPLNIDDRNIMSSIINILLFFTFEKKGKSITVKSENSTLDSYSMQVTGFEKGRFVKITVKDKKRYLDKNELLEAFTPGINLEKGTGSNTSAGLIAAYWTIEKNGGRLVVSSEKHSGTEFCIFLPAQ